MSYRIKNSQNNFRDDSSKKLSRNFKGKNRNQKNVANSHSIDTNRKSSNTTKNSYDKNREQNQENTKEFKGNRNNDRGRSIEREPNMPGYTGRIDNSNNHLNPNRWNQRRRFSARRDIASSRDNSQISKENRNSLTSGREEQIYLSNEQTDLVWGRHSTQAAFETGRPIHRIWCTTEIRSSSKFFQFLKDAKSSGVLVEEVSWARLAQITKGAVHQGIALQTASAETIDLPKLIQACGSLTESPLLLALDGITDPHNLGAIIRSAEALGAHGLILPQRRSAGLTGSVAKVAAGALEHLPVARVVNLNRSLTTLKEQGYRVIGLAEEGGSTLQEVDLEGPLIVVIGSEGKGLSLLTRKHCDQLVRIPLRGITTSLNASIATSVVLYEIARNTWMKGISGQSPSPKLLRAKFPLIEN
tara:strand:- start:162 stop:1406 length:1245 start_codon:yes stop_codon:yes gene_type:complete